MNVKTWFESGTGYKIKELRYLKPPELPYFLFINRINNRGADLLNNIIENNITIERYSETNAESDVTEIDKVDDLLDENHYTFERQTEWLDSENLYETAWVLEPILEKIRKED